MSTVNKLRKEYQVCMKLRKERYNELAYGRKDVDSKKSVQDFNARKDIWIQINDEERQPIDESGNHNIGVPTRGKKPPR